MIQIYCDLDGVLTNFELSFKRVSKGISALDYKNLYGEDKFWDLINTEGIYFWVSMPWIPGGYELWNHIKKYKPTILSAHSRDTFSKEGKKIWIRSHLRTPKFILVPSSHEKQNYSGENKILIDDYDRNILEWESKGGVGILHRNYKDTIKQLKKHKL